MWETQVRSLGRERSPVEGNGNPLQYLAWRIPWTEEESGGLQSVGSQRVRHNWATNNLLLVTVIIRWGWLKPSYLNHPGGRAALGILATPHKHRLTDPDRNVWVSSASPHGYRWGN